MDQFIELSSAVLNTIQIAAENIANDDNVIDKTQLRSMAELYQYMLSLTDPDCSESVVAHFKYPEARHGYITATMSLIDFDSSEFEQFSRIVSKCSNGVAFIAKTDGTFLVDLIVPNVFRGTA